MDFRIRKPTRELPTKTDAARTEPRRELEIALRWDPALPGMDPPEDSRVLSSEVEFQELTSNLSSDRETIYTDDRARISMPRTRTSGSRPRGWLCLTHLQQGDPAAEEPVRTADYYG